MNQTTKLFPTNRRGPAAEQSVCWTPSHRRNQSSLDQDRQVHLQPAQRNLEKHPVSMPPSAQKKQTTLFPDDTEFFTANQNQLYSRPAMAGPFKHKGGNFDEQSTSKPSIRQGTKPIMGEYAEQTLPMEQPHSQLALDMLQTKLSETVPWDLAHSGSDLFEYVPLTSEVPQSARELPSQLQQEPITCSHLGRYLVYIGTQHSFKVWDPRSNSFTSHKLDYIEAIHESRCTNSRAPCAQFQGHRTQDLLVVVGTTRGAIHLIRVMSGERSAFQLRLDTVHVVEQASTMQSPARCFGELHKNGRIFYGGAEGHLCELRFEDFTGHIYQVFTKQAKKLKSVDYEKQIWLTSLFFKAPSCELLQLQIDQQRNILYCHKKVLEGTQRGESLIIGYFLGVLGEQTSQFVKIDTERLGEALSSFTFQEQSQIYERGFARQPASAVTFPQVQVSHVFPISFAESESYHLMVLTNQQERIFIRFDEKSFGQASQKEVQERGLQQVLIIPVGPEPEFQVVAVQGMPSTKQLFAGLVAARYYQGILEPFQLGSTNAQLEPEHLCQVSQFDSCLTYLIPTQKSAESLLLGSLRRCQGQYEHAKLLNQNKGSLFQINWQFNFLLLAAGEQANSAASQDLQTQKCRARKRAKEELLQIGELLPSGSDQSMELMGHRQVGASVWGRETSFQPYNQKAWNPVEQQVYLQQETQRVLTSHRLITLVSLRPIDQLAMILQANHSSGPFESFVNHYTLESTCTMLIQILTSPKARYLFTSRFAKAISMRGLPFEKQMSPRKVRLQTSSQQASVLDQFSRSNLFRRSTDQQQNMSYSLARQQSQDLFSQENHEARLYAYDLKNHEADQYSTTAPLLTQAMTMLKRYGNTILALNFHQFQQRVSQFGVGEDAADQRLSEGQDDQPILLTIKHLSLHEYLMRLIRPVWDLSLVAQADYRKATQCESNVHLFGTVQGKLEEFQRFLEHQTTLLVDVSSKGELSQEILDLYVPMHEFPQQLQEQIEVNESALLKQMQRLISRVVGLFNLIRAATHSADQLKKTVASLNEENVQKLTSLKFFDLLSFESATFIRKLLQAVIATAGEDGQFRDLISQLRLVLFTKDESVIFTAEALLNEALKKPIHSEEHKRLVSEALDNLAQAPMAIDLTTLIPAFLNNGDITAALKGCLMKAEADPRGAGGAQARELFLELIDGIASSITKRKVQGQFAKILRDQIDGCTNVVKERNLARCIQTIALNKALLQDLLTFYAGLCESHVCDMICEHLSPECVASALKLSGMSRKEFDIKYRLLQKSRCFTNLNELVVKAVTDQIQIDPPIKILERLKLVQDCISTSRIDQSTQTSELKECLKVIMAQIECIEQIKLKHGDKTLVDKLCLETKLLGLDDQYRIYNEHELFYCSLRQLLDVQFNQETEGTKQVKRLEKLSERYLNELLLKDDKQKLIRQFFNKTLKKSARKEVQRLREFCVDYLIQKCITGKFKSASSAGDDAGAWVLRMLQNEPDCVDLADLMKKWSQKGMHEQAVHIYLTALKLWLATADQGDIKAEGPQQIAHCKAIQNLLVERGQEWETNTEKRLTALSDACCTELLAKMEKLGLAGFTKGSYPLLAQPILPHGLCALNKTQDYHNHNRLEEHSQEMDRSQALAHQGGSTQRQLKKKSFSPKPSIAQSFGAGSHTFNEFLSPHKGANDKERF